MQEISEVNDAKWLLPVLITVASLLIGAGGAVGAYYLRTEFSKLKNQIEGSTKSSLSELEKKLHDEFDDLSKKSAEDTALREKTIDAKFKVVDALLNYKDAGVRYRDALFAWQQNPPDYDQAIAQMTSVLQSVEEAIKLFEGVNSSGVLAPRNLDPYRVYRCRAIGDLAYFLAGHYQQGRPDADSARGALTNARRLTREWSIFKEGPPLNLIDDYLYVLATVKAITTNDDLNEGKALWKNFKLPLTEFFANGVSKSG